MSRDINFQPLTDQQRWEREEYERKYGGPNQQTEKFDKLLAEAEQEPIVNYLKDLKEPGFGKVMTTAVQISIANKKGITPKGFNDPKVYGVQIGLCTKCKEWTDANDPCCGSGNVRTEGE